MLEFFWMPETGSMTPGVPIPMTAGLFSPDSRSSIPTTLTTWLITWSYPFAPSVGSRRRQRAQSGLAGSITAPSILVPPKSIPKRLMG